MPGTVSELLEQIRQEKIAAEEEGTSSKKDVSGESDLVQKIKEVAQKDVSEGSSGESETSGSSGSSGKSEGSGESGSSGSSKKASLDTELLMKMAQEITAQDEALTLRKAELIGAAIRDGMEIRDQQIQMAKLADYLASASEEESDEESLDKVAEALESDPEAAKAFVAGMVDAYTEKVASDVEEVLEDEDAVEEVAEVIENDPEAAEAFIEGKTAAYIEKVASDVEEVLEDEDAVEEVAEVIENDPEAAEAFIEGKTAAYAEKVASDVEEVLEDEDAINKVAEVLESDPEAAEAFEAGRIAAHAEKVASDVEEVLSDEESMAKVADILQKDPEAAQAFEDGQNQAIAYKIASDEDAALEAIKIAQEGNPLPDAVSDALAYSALTNEKVGSVVAKMIEDNPVYALATEAGQLYADGDYLGAIDKLAEAEKQANLLGMSNEVKNLAKIAEQIGEEAAVAMSSEIFDLGQTVGVKVASELLQ